MTKFFYQFVKNDYLPFFCVVNFGIINQVMKKFDSFVKKFFTEKVIGVGTTSD